MLPLCIECNLVHDWQIRVDMRKENIKQLLALGVGRHVLGPDSDCEFVLRRHEGRVGLELLPRLVGWVLGQVGSLSTYIGC